MIRREFLKIAGASAAGSIALLQWAEEKVALAASNQLVYQGTDLTGWAVALGDGLYSAPGQSSVTEADIATSNFGAHSALQANIQHRGIMAHNITYQQQVDSGAFDYVHLCEYEFRLPYMPTTSNWELNAQTVEMSCFIWDGTATQTDYGLAVQWILNPWMSSFGDIRVWMSSNNAAQPISGAWHSVGHLDVDTNWHSIKMAIDYQYQTTSLMIDGQHYLSSFSGTPKPATWAAQTVARLGAEIISLYPGNSSSAPTHQAEVRNWKWHWIPALAGASTA